MYFAFVRRKSRARKHASKNDTGSDDSQSENDKETENGDSQSEDETETDEPSAEGFARWHSIHCASRAPTTWPEPPPELQRLGPKSVELLYVDPPWPYLGNAGGGLAGMVGKQYYETPEMSSLFSFIDAWLEPYLADDCALLLWATGPRMHAALGLMSAWRFDYKNEFFIWLKTYQNDEPVLGLGRYTRTCTEKVLLGARGDVRRLMNEVSYIFDDVRLFLDIHRVVRQDLRRKTCQAQDVPVPALRAVGAAFGEQGRHSEKPAEFREKIKSIFSNTSVRLELFARQRVEGWIPYGNEVPRSSQKSINSFFHKS
jgi:N6-adenosine-specific RNA methylase IME4